ncbi:MAG: sigma-70 family RNA polymerase sigma factor [Candidatus Omnitrophica bacterium]|nr:sigma-70 family RNA polymerase sigma factor [Candidatus Omnitrophota bacterium]MCM8776758.1 sigma-70 family RNA polymerase sigma factor [Candidatus Omnitrophota bacterium]
MTNTDGEAVLVERAKNGDMKAFEDLIKITSGRIYNLGLRMLHNKEDAADIMQETYIAAYENLPKFKGTSSFSTWLYRIATNFALMKMRKEKGRKVSEERLKDISKNLYNTAINDWTDSPVDHLKKQELKTALDKAIESLPPKYRSVFVLHDIEGLPIAEVADILSISKAAVKTRSHRSRLYLREKLSEYFKESGVKNLIRT